MFVMGYNHGAVLGKNIINNYFLFVVSSVYGTVGHSSVFNSLFALLHKYKFLVDILG
jgi:hypothetical protein